jgi:hypothetical protein
MPACVVTSVNEIGPDGRVGAESDAEGGAAEDGFEDSVDASRGGAGKEFDLQPMIDNDKSARHKAKHTFSGAKEHRCSVRELK